MIATPDAALALAEEIIPAAVRSIGGGAFGDLSLFANNVPVERAFTSARASGNAMIRPDGIGVPVVLVNASHPNPAKPPYLRAHMLSREFHVVGCEFGDLIKNANRRQFVSWQLAVEAGYDGCATCQPQFNVAAFGELAVTFVGAPVGFETPAVAATYVGTAKRFGVPIGRLVETINKGRGQMVGTNVEFVVQRSRLVPGPWDVTFSWGTWSTSHRVDVAKRWINASGNLEGSRTKVRVNRGATTIQVTHE